MGGETRVCVLGGVTIVYYIIGLAANSFEMG